MQEDGLNVWEFRRAAIMQACSCDGPGVLGGVAVKEDGKSYCTSCGKAVKIETFIILGCSKCGKESWKKLDEIEKEVYGPELPKE